MKKRSRKAQLRRKHEFRFYNRMSINRRGKLMRYRHPAYIFLQKGNIYIFVTITHSDAVQNQLCIQLKKNPNPKDPTNAYYVAEILQDTKDRFRRKLDNWDIDLSDDEAIRKLYKKR